MTKPKDPNTAAPTEAGSGSSLNKNKEIKKLLDLGVQRGFLTYVEVNELLPLDVLTPASIDEIMTLLGENEIEVIDAAKRPKESEDEEEGHAAEEPPLGPTPAEEEAAAAAETAQYAKGADPVKLYLKKMGSVS